MLGYLGIDPILKCFAVFEIVLEKQTKFTQSTTILNVKILIAMVYFKFIFKK